VRSTSLAILLVCGCGSDASTPPMPDAPPDAPFTPQGARDYCEAIEPFFCEFYVRCGRMDVTTVEACEDDFLAKCNAVFEPRYLDLEAAGLLVLDIDGIEACRAHLATVACDQQFQELSGPCADMWRGTQSVGQTCGLDVESFACAPGSECVLDLSLCGECRAVVPVGMTCTPGTDTCGAEATCDDGTCRARVRDGQPCTPDDTCLVGSVCDAGTCRAPQYVKRGDACDARHRCPYLTVCTGGTCQPTSALGDACTNDGVCEIGYCDGTCTAPLANGATCARPTQCASGICEGTCQARPSACIAD
jgi:hypothetical protein